MKRQLVLKGALLKGALIFGFLGFAVFLILILLGMVMSALGFSCNCYQIFSWSLMGVAAVSGLIFWYGCCCQNPEDGNCKGVKGFRDSLN